MLDIANFLKYLKLNATSGCSLIVMFENSPKEKIQKFDLNISLFDASDFILIETVRTVYTRCHDKALEFQNSHFTNYIMNCNVLLKPDAAVKLK